MHCLSITYYHIDMSDYFISWEEFHRDSRSLALQLLDGEFLNDIHGLVAIARGGLVPTAILARELDIKYVDSLCISSYNHKQQGELDVLKSIPGDGEGLLMIDDLVDSGKTAIAARELLPKAKFVTIYAKPAGRDTTDAFVKEFEQDIWLHFPWDSSSEQTYSTPLVDQQNNEVITDS